MTTDQGIPNIHPLDTARNDLFAFEITGHVTAGDVEAVYERLADAYAAHPKIDLLVRLTNYDGWDWNVITREATLVGKTRALKHIRRYAVVGGPGWIAGMVKLFDPFFTVEMKHFPEAQEVDAWSWLDSPAEL